MKLSLFFCVMQGIIFFAGSFILTLTVSSRNLGLFTTKSEASRVTSAKIRHMESGR